MMSLLSPPNTQPLEYIGILKRKANISLKYEWLKFPLNPTREKIVTRYFKVQKNTKKYLVLPLDTKLMMNWDLYLRSDFQFIFSLYKIEIVFMGIKQPAWARSDLIKSVVLVNSAQSGHPHHIIPWIKAWGNDSCLY